MSGLSPAIPRGGNVVRFLAERPEFAGVGKVTAQKLWDRFGEGIYRILASGDAESLSELLPRTQADIVCDAWRSQQALADCVVFFDEQGIDARIARKAVEFWGDDAVAKLKDNPYRLLTVCPWSQVDTLARRLGLAADDPRRMVGAVEAAMFDRLDGKHTATAEPLLIGAAAKLLRCGHESALAALGRAVADGAAVASPAGFQPAGAAHMERYVEGRVRDALGYGQRDLLMGPRCPGDLARFLDGYDAGQAHSLTEEQRLAIGMALDVPVSMLIGGAGVGKTACLRAVNAAARHFGFRVRQIALAGRAAQHMAEATGQPAQTIASWLRAAADGKDAAGPDTLLVVDEASMLDLSTTYRLLFHVHGRARVLLVGDTAQLPPIGFGLVLHRLTATGTVPRIELTRILRSGEATGIPAASRAVRQGIVPDLADGVPGADGCSFVEAAPADIVGTLARLFPTLGDGSAQVVGAVYRGLAGIDAVNIAFHARNARGRPCTSRFAAGDPVIWTVNDYNRALWNGSMGRVLEIAGDGGLTAMLDGCEVRLEPGDLADLDLAYAISTHKAQGSQFDTVIVLVVASRPMDRALLYTAMTRGIRRVVFIGSRAVFEDAVRWAPASLARDVAFTV